MYNCTGLINSFVLFSNCIKSVYLLIEVSVHFTSTVNEAIMFKLFAVVLLALVADVCISLLIVEFFPFALWSIHRNYYFNIHYYFFIIFRLLLCDMLFSLI